MLVDTVRKTIQEYNLIAAGDMVLVGVSGGPDSVTLLTALHALSGEMKFSVHVGHLDHMLRKDSLKDMKFVLQLARTLGLPFTSAQVNVKALARKGSLEEIARNARLGFLFNCAREIKAQKIALGHTLDDQAETVLMRIIRGSGLYGLSGILPKREICGYQLIRPLIKVRRAEINAFVNKRKLKVCTDASNAEDIYFRNRIRNKLLPLLEKKYNRQIKDILSHMAEGIGYDYDCLDKIADGLMSAYPHNKIPLSYCTAMHPSLRRLLMRRTLAVLQGDTRRITFQHIKEIEDMVFNRPVKSIVDLPKGISVAKTKNNIVFYRRDGRGTFPNRINKCPPTARRKPRAA